jgi:hypothetical protein
MSNHDPKLYELHKNDKAITIAITKASQMISSQGKKR